MTLKQYYYEVLKQSYQKVVAKYKHKLFVLEAKIATANREANDSK